MKNNNLSLGAHVTCFLVLIFFMGVVITSSRSLPVLSSSHFSFQEEGTKFGDQSRHVSPQELDAEEKLGIMKPYQTGSSLPDCSHACGPCSPCKRMLVGLKCFTESCPTVYKCMCKGKYYPIPSN
ncbi:protein EPIDERMAL PATTERNING FACTOR 2-like [Juglans microcarpa x Juglans regia]|uniref:protein EPIDERMAL PATTERNING FACTOR 2-like n=1 Tax=Juglans microcarpa x Juglans regia TaxID=2249226 RepID=UPI001B7E5173|nr:protein EPIDERMAL PATTERNING FACTOR 2-like [Juglans microcarpa x Juglans regia]